MSHQLLLCSVRFCQRTKKNKTSDNRLFICFTLAMAGNGVTFSEINNIFSKYNTFELISMFFFGTNLRAGRKSNCIIYSTESICKFVHREPVHSNTLNSLDNPAKFVFKYVASAYVYVDNRINIPIICTHVY